MRRDRGHVRGQAVQMYGHDGASFRCDRRFDLADIDIAGSGIGVHEYRSGAGQPDGFRGSKESVGGGDDLVAGAESQRQKHQQQRVGAGIDAHGFLRLHVTRKLFFELDQLRAEHVASALQHIQDGLINLGLQIVVLLHVAIKADVGFGHGGLPP